MREQVYFIAALYDNGKVQSVKIGRSVDVEARLDWLQMYCPLRLRLLASVDGWGGLEQALHERFESDHIRGEWFRDGPALRAAIEALQRGDLEAVIPSSDVRGKLRRLVIRHVTAESFCAKAGVRQQVFGRIFLGVKPGAVNRRRIEEHSDGTIGPQDWDGLRADQVRS